MKETVALKRTLAAEIIEKQRLMNRDNVMKWVRVLVREKSVRKILAKIKVEILDVARLETQVKSRFEKTATIIALILVQPRAQGAHPSIIALLEEILQKAIVLLEIPIEVAQRVEVRAIRVLRAETQVAEALVARVQDEGEEMDSCIFLKAVSLKSPLWDFSFFDLDQS